MKIRARKDFISSAFGNVSEGQVLIADDNKARLLIENNLADEIIDSFPPNFTQPEEKRQSDGLSLRADQASTMKTSTLLKDGKNYRRKKTK